MSTEYQNAPDRYARLRPQMRDRIRVAIIETLTKTGPVRVGYLGDEIADHTGWPTPFGPTPEYLRAVRARMEEEGLLRTFRDPEQRQIPLMIELVPEDERR